MTRAPGVSLPLVLNFMSLRAGSSTMNPGRRRDVLEPAGDDHFLHLVHIVVEIPWRSSANRPTYRRAVVAWGRSRRHWCSTPVELAMIRRLLPLAFIAPIRLVGHHRIDVDGADLGHRVCLARPRPTIETTTSSPVEDSVYGSTSGPGCRL